MFLGMERNIVAVSTSMLLLSLGENLWRKFLPRYLQALGAPIRAIGLFGSLEDFLDGVYQYPGGWLGDRLITKSDNDPQHYQDAAARLAPATTVQIVAPVKRVEL